MIPSFDCVVPGTSLYLALIVLSQGLHYIWLWLCRLWDFIVSSFDCIVPGTLLYLALTIYNPTDIIYIFTLIHYIQLWLYIIPLIQFTFNIKGSKTTRIRCFLIRLMTEQFVFLKTQQSNRFANHQQWVCPLSQANATLPTKSLSEMMDQLSEALWLTMVRDSSSGW